MTAKTLYDKLWDDHVICDYGDGTALIYIDRHLIHEVTSPQAFEGLKLAGRRPWRLNTNLTIMFPRLIEKLLKTQYRNFNLILWTRIARKQE